MIDEPTSTPATVEQSLAQGFLIVSVILIPMVAITIWNEYRHERENDAAKGVYPDGIHRVLADMLSEYGHDIRTATLDEPDHGLAKKVLDQTEVLLW